MTSNLDEVQKFGKEQLAAASSLTASFAKGFQGVAAEATEFSKKSIEANSAYIERLMGAKSLDDAVQFSPNMRSPLTRGWSRSSPSSVNSMPISPRKASGRSKPLWPKLRLPLAAKPRSANRPGALEA